MPNNPNIDTWAKVLWEYHLLHHQLRPADCILVLGSNDLRVAEHAAHLFLQGLAPVLVFSGDVGRLTHGKWNKSEAEVFAGAAIKLGVPKEKIYIEPQSLHTGQNITYSKELLARKGIHPRTVLVVQKPYMERRAFATFRKRWPEANVIISSPPISYEAYPTKDISKDALIHILVGDTERIWKYGKSGEIVPQDVPEEVVNAYRALVSLGFTNNLMEPMKTVVVASKNPVKIHAAHDAFIRMFPGQSFEVTGVRVESGVARQPTSDAETLNGAFQRAENARRANPAADFWVGIEGGVELKDDQMEAFAWVVVLSADGIIGRGRTGTFFLPQKVTELIVQGKELGEADDIVFGRVNSKQNNGAVGILTGDVIDRTRYYSMAVVLALIPFKNPDIYLNRGPA